MWVLLINRRRVSPKVYGTFTDRDAANWTAKQMGCDSWIVLPLLVPPRWENGERIETAEI